MVEIEHYVEARRGTLTKYLEELNPNLWGIAQKARPPAKNPNMILWSKQKVISKKELRMMCKDDERRNN